MLVPSGLICSLALFCAQVQKLNGPMPPNPGLGGGDVSHLFAVSPDGSWFAYVANQEDVEIAELWAGPVDGSSAPVRISAPMVAGGDVVGRGLVFTPDGSALVFRADAETDGVVELFVAPRAGSAPPRKLNGSFVEGGGLAEDSVVVPYQISADSLRLVYVAAQETPNEYELWSVPLDGSAPAVRLSGPMPSGGDVSSYLLSADGTHVLFRAAALVGGHGLYSVSIDGSAPPVLLHPPLGESNGIGSYRFSADGTHALFLADLGVDELFTLWRVPLDASAAPLALTVPASERDITEFEVAATGRVVFIGDLRADGGFEVFSAPDDFSAPHVRLSGTIVAGGDASGLLVEPDGQHAVYVADARHNDRFELFRVPVAGGAEPVRVSGSLGRFGDVSGARFSRDGTHVLYLAEPEGNARHLYASPLAHPAARRLSGELIPRGAVTEFVAAGGFVLFRADAVLDEEFELFAAPIDGWPPPARSTTGGATLVGGPLRLHTPLGFNTNFEPGAFALTDGGLALWGGAHAIPRMSELFAQPADASAPARRLNGALTEGPPASSVQAFVSNGEHVFYAGEQLEAEQGELFRVLPAEAPAFTPLVEFADPRSVRKLALTPDGARLVYTADALVRGHPELFSVLADGSAPPVRLGAGFPATDPLATDGFEFTPDGSRVLFVARVDALGSALFSAPVDGSTPPALLLGPLHNSSSFHFEVAAAGLVVVRSDVTLDQRFELLRVPLDGSAPAETLFPGLAGGSVREFALNPGGSLVFFSADALVDEQYELWRVPAEGSVLPERLFPTASGFLLHDGWKLTADKLHLVFTGRQLPFGDTEIYVVRTEVGSEPVLLHPSHPLLGHIGEFVLTPSGAQAIYIEYDSPSEDPALFSARLDGTTPPVQLTARLAELNASFERLVMSPDGSAVLLEVRSQVRPVELWLVSLVGRHRPRALRTLHGATEYRFSPDGARVFLRSASVNNGSIELFAGANDDRTPLTRVNDPLVAGGNVTAFGFHPGSRAVIYRADQELDGVFELYFAPWP